MVKILAGEFRSRKLLTRDGEMTRPILSRVKESVFGMLHEWFADARVLDLYAGVGTVGLEAVSRGATEVLMVENDPRTYSLLRENIERLGCGDRARTMRGDALGAGCLQQAPTPVDLVFVDPPYRVMEDTQQRARIFEQIGRCRSIMADRGFVILRSPLGPDELELSPPGFSGPEVHRYRKDMHVFLWAVAPKPPS